MKRTMKRIAPFLAFGATCLTAGLPSEARAKEQWDKAEIDLQKLGVDYLVCKDIPDQLVCLGVGCGAGSFELVSIRSGSGAFVGDVKLSAGKKKFDVRFADHDQKIMDVIGTSGSRAPASRDMVEAMAKAGKITIREAKPKGHTESYLARGLEALVGDPEGKCAAIK